MKKCPPFTCLNLPMLSVSFWLTLAFVSCKPAEPKAVAGKGDMTGLELVEIPGSAIQHAYRKDGNAQVSLAGYVSNNQRTGQWVEYGTQGEVFKIENYVDGFLDGLSLQFASRGQIETKANYEMGILEGSWVHYKFGKPIEERNYKAGKLEGVVRIYDDRAFKIKQEIEYKDGLQHGFFRHYNPEGKVTLEYEYKNGEKVSGGIVEEK